MNMCNDVMNQTIDRRQTHKDTAPTERRLNGSEARNECRDEAHQLLERVVVILAPSIEGMLLFFEDVHLNCPPSQFLQLCPHSQAPILKNILPAGYQHQADVRQGRSRRSAVWMAAGGSVSGNASFQQASENVILK